MPGRIVRGLPLKPAEELWVHELAGQALKPWHARSEPISGPQREAILASVADQAEEAAACLQRIAEHLTHGQRGLV